MTLSNINHKLPISRWLFLIIIILFTLPSISGTMCIPALPSITQEFPTQDTLIQLTLTTFILGFSFSHLVYGPLSDRIGRKKPLLIGIFLNMLGCLICYFSVDMAMLLLGRLIQGLGVGACNSVARSLIRDLLTDIHLAKLGSQIGIYSTILLAISPLLGGWLDEFFNWKIIFLLLAIYSLLICYLIYYWLPETNPNLNPNATQWRVMLQNYLTILKNKLFIGFTLCSCLAYAGIMAYLTAAPFLLEKILILTPAQFGGLIFILESLASIAAFANTRLVVKRGILLMILLGSGLMLSAGVFLLTASWLGITKTLIVFLPILIFRIGTVFIFANSAAGAFQPFSKKAGSVGALFGCVQIFGGFISSATMAALPDNTEFPLACLFVLLGVFSISIVAVMQAIIGESRPLFPFYELNQRIKGYMRR